MKMSRNSMNIAIVSIFDVSLLKEYVYPEDRERIGELNSNFTPAVASLTLELLKKGERIIIFTQDIKARKIEEFHGERVDIYVAPKIPFYRNILTLGTATVFAIKKLFPLHKGPIDVVSAHWTRDYAIAAEHFINKIPVFVTIRDILPYIITQVKTNRLRWRLIWLKNEYVLRRKGYRFIANSEYTAHEVKRYWGHDIPVIPNSVTVCDSAPSSKENAKNATDEIVITTISLGDFTDQRKNIPTLLKAFSKFRKNHPKSILRLIGPYFIETNNLVKEYQNSGLMEGVVLMGRRSPQEVSEILLESTMMVHPSLEETFGNTLIEALAHGVPVVGGINSGAVPWVLEHGKLGYLCDVSSPDEIAESMLHVIEDYTEARGKAIMGKKKCITTYSADGVANEYLRLFGESIDHKP